MPRLYLLAGLIGLAFALQVLGLDFQSLWRDEIDAIRFASRPLPELLRMFTQPGQNGPLYYLILRPWLDLAGQTAFALRFLSAACGTLAVPLVYRLGRRLYPTQPGLALLAAALAATSPYLLWYGQEGKMYTLVVVLVLVSMDRYLAALARGGWQRWLVYVVATILACYVHLVAALMIPVQGLIFFLQAGEVRRARWKPWLASLAALTLPYLPLLVWQLPLLLKPAVTGYSFVPLPQMLVSLVTSYSLGVIQQPRFWTLLLFLAPLLAAVLLPGAAHLRSAGVLACWLVLPVLGFFLITLVRPMYTARYLVFVLPAYLLLLAAGLIAIAQQLRPDRFQDLTGFQNLSGLFPGGLLVGLWLVAMLAANGWGLWLQARTPLKADFRAATAYLAPRLAPGDLVLFQIPYGRYSFDFYYEQQARQPGDEAVPQPDTAHLSPVAIAGQTPSTVRGQRLFLPLVVSGRPPYRWADGLYTNAGMTPDQVDRQMAALTAGSQAPSSGTLWFVATEVPLWDERGLVQAWLNQHVTLVDAAEFLRVAVYRYKVP